MTQMEFETTMQPGSDAPRPPPGEGWHHTGAANARYGQTTDRVFHYWQRPTPTKFCGKCGSTAFIEGKCVGCVTPLENIHQSEEAAMITIDEASVHSGYCYAAIHGWIRQGLLTGTRLGSGYKHNVRIPKAEFERFLEALCGLVPNPRAKNTKD